MARKPNPDAVIENDPVAPEVAAALSQTQDVVVALQGAHNDERDTLNQIIGQVQMGRALSKFADVVSLTKLAHIKETRMYKALAGKKGVDREGNEIADVGTWEGFCLALGTSKTKVDEDILNLKTFGQEAMADLSRIGAGYRELRQLRKLPDDEKTALLEAAQSGDKEVFLDLAEEIISRQTAAKAIADENFSELEKEHQTQGEILAEAKQETLSLKAELKKLKPGTTMWENAIADLKEEITKLQNFIDESVARQDEAVDAIDSWLTAHVVNQPGYDPEAPFVMPAQALTVLVHLDDCINRSAHLVAAARHKLHNEFGSYLADARRHLLIDSEE
jgi:hypothetical protein